MAKFQLPTSTKGGSKGFAPPRKTATKTAPRPKARPLAPARFESKPPPPPPTDPVGAWACLYAKKGPKKKITWLDGEVFTGARVCVCARGVLVHALDRI